MKTYRVEAFVLRMRPLGEADRILTLFSRERGKITAVAKGARKTKSKFGARLDFFSRSDLALHAGKSLDVITHAAAKPAVWDRLVHPEAYALASYVAEVVDGLCEPDLAVPDLFDVLCELERALRADRPAAALVPAVDMRMLAALGFAPELDACARCGAQLGRRPLVGGRARLQPQAGGLVCRACCDALASDGQHGRGAKDVMSVSAAELTLLRSLRDGDLIQLSNEPTLPRLARVTNAFVQYHLGRRPKALAVAQAQDSPRHGPRAKAAS